MSNLRHDNVRCLQCPESIKIRRSDSLRNPIGAFSVKTRKFLLYRYVAADVLHGHIAAEAELAVAGQIEALSCLYLDIFGCFGQTDLAHTVYYVHYLRISRAELIVPRHEKT